MVLDWSRLLGFDQVGAHVRRTPREREELGPKAPLRLSALGAKISVKPGVKRANE